MHVPRPRTARTTGLLAAAAAMTVGLLPATPAAAVTGPQAAAGSHPYAVQLTLGEEPTTRGCTGTLVDRYWVLTAASCFATTPGTPVPAGKPAVKATATLGDGKSVALTELAPRADRDVVLARLATPVTTVPVAPLATAAPAAGTDLTAAGFGRTRTAWVPDRLHTGTFTVDSADTATLRITGKGTDAICKGDTGGPLLDAAGRVVGVNSQSWQGGCFGGDPAETRTGAVSARVDGLAEWVRQQSLTTASIRNAFSDRCLFVSWRTPENGAQARQADCEPQYADQVWKLQPVAGGGYQIRNTFTDRCLFVSWRTPENGAPVQQFDCEPKYSDQVWKLEPVTSGGYQIRNAFTNRCMVVSWRTPENGAPVQQFDCEPKYSDQVWKL
ncbi:trypsin-like serine protease [Streptomyces sp. DH12]|uniref:trypsin-like serine protease n=1 Tax=Streptomyces sp. DH12 TaxID=2857010 RepID=UPI001E639C1C|nr:trypsin-like serine protease [Streptomyces sp. DH12]